MTIAAPILLRMLRCMHQGSSGSESDIGLFNWIEVSSAERGVT
jgi:hypothetical protein